MKKKEITQLEFDQLTFKNAYGSSVLENVTMQMPMNSIVWIRGPSGSGKSLIGKILCGLIMPSSGAYRINGVDVTQMTFEEILPYRCNMGYSFDFGGLINNRDILSNLLLPIQYHNFDFGKPHQLIQRVNYFLNLFGLDKVGHDRPSALAGRLRKAACVARAFIHDPAMVVLDDPTTGLRPEVIHSLQNYINEKFQKTHLRHVFILTEDETFMRAFRPVVLDLTKFNRVQAQSRGVA